MQSQNPATVSDSAVKVMAESGVPMAIIEPGLA
jgi:hypothetical protein